MNRACLITGATGGLGRALAEAFCAAGYHVVLTGRDESALEDLAKQLPAPGRADAVAADLTDPGDVRRLGDRVRDLTGRLDVVVANAGVAAGGSFLFPDESLEEWRDMVLVNVFGTAAVARTTLPMLAETHGSLLFVGSVTGRMIVPGDLYSVTKHAVSVLAEEIRAEVEPAGLHVCVIQPGLMDTPMVSAARRSRPMLTPADVAAAAVRLVAADRPFQVNELVLRPTTGRAEQ